MHSKNQNLHLNQDGSSILYVLIGSMILLGGILFLFGLTKNFSEKSKKDLSRFTKSTLSFVFDLHAQDCGALSNSRVDENDALQICLEGTTDCQQGIKYPFLLFPALPTPDRSINHFPSLTNLSSLSELTIAGYATSSKSEELSFYSLRGEKCSGLTTATQACPLQALGFFQVYCENNAPQCHGDQVQSIHILYELRVAPDIQGISLKPINNDLSLQNTNSLFVHSRPEGALKWLSPDYTALAPCRMN